jgi:RimJ/RimL family protein N-acetyltransferase
LKATAPVPHIISLLPLSAEYHTAALQRVYAATPGYWAMYNFPGCPPDQAANEFAARAETPDRFLLGIVRRIDPLQPEAGVEMIGVIDFRLQWPGEDLAYIGMLMVAEPYQRQAVATQAWSLLKPWLSSSAHIRTVRVGVEQFNMGCLKFWQSAGFTMTGEAARIRVGDKFVRLLYMEQPLAAENPQE